MGEQAAQRAWYGVDKSAFAWDSLSPKRLYGVDVMSKNPKNHPFPGCYHVEVHDEVRQWVLFSFGDTQVKDQDQEG